MAHVDAMTARLPQLYREGELVHGVLALFALQLEVLDEDLLAVQRSHWFRQALERDDAAALAALLDLTPEAWQDIDLFRAWVDSVRDALLRDGAVTVRALQRFVQRYAARFQATTGLRLLADLAVDPDSGQAATWEDTPGPGRPAFVETPRRRREGPDPPGGPLEPLATFEVVQRGLDPTPAAFLLTGLPGGPEQVPLVANLTNASALVYLGSVPVGARLWLRPRDDGTVAATLEGADVSDRLRSVAGFTPGVPWADAQVQRPARALMLERGSNRLWFLPVALFDEPGLDRFLLALPDLDLHQGRFDQTAFDRSLFAQAAAIRLRMAWTETEPASFDVRLPAGAMLSEPGRLAAALDDRRHLGASLDEAVGRLRAAGVRSAVTLDPLVEVAPQLDLMTGVQPLVRREPGPTGADRLPDAGGLFDVTRFGDSTFR